MITVSEDVEVGTQGDFTVVGLTSGGYTAQHVLITMQEKFVNRSVIEIILSVSQLIYVKTYRNYNMESGAGGVGEGKMKVK